MSPIQIICVFWMLVGVVIFVATSIVAIIESSERGEPIPKLPVVFLLSIEVLVMLGACGVFG